MKEIKNSSKEGPDEPIIGTEAINSIKSVTKDTSSSNYDSFLEIDDDGERDFYGSIDMEEEEEARTISTSKFKDDGEEQEVEKEKITPLPKLQLFIISIVLVCEPLTFAVLLPFIYFMLKDFHLSDDEKQIGSYAGWITSMFFVAQFCTAIIWGKISDRYGRRTVLLTGLLGNAISSCLFGMSKSLSWAIASRTLCGIMNGNAGAARSMVNEITDKTNKAKAFSLFGFCWGLGMIAGPVLGGYLVKPAEHFPIIFGNSEFFKAYPYSLPCFAASTASIFGFSIGYFFLKESNPIVIAKNHSIERQQNLVADEATSLLAKKPQASTVTAKNPDKSTTTEKAGSLRDVPSTSIIVISGYFVYAIHSMVFDEVLPLYFTAPKYAGGLGISTQEFAEILSFFGLVQIVSQVVIYPRLTRHFDILSVTRWAFVLIVPVYVLFPELTSIQNWSLKIISPFLNFGSAISRGVAENSGGNTLTLAIGYVILLSIRCVTTASTFTGFNLMVNMSAPSEILGIVNGVNMAVTALARAFGPTFGGTIWSYSLQEGNKYPFDHHLIYYLIASLAIINLAHSFFIPPSVALGGKKSKHA